MNPEVSERNEYADEDWLRLVDDLSGGPLHLPQVHLVDHPADSLRHFVFRDGDREVACGPGFALSSGRRWLGSRQRTLHLPTPPAARDAAMRKAACLSLLDHCREVGYQRLSIGHGWGESFADLEPFSDHITGDAFDFVIDLGRDPETLLSAMHKTHRKNIRRAGRSDLTVGTDGSLEGLLELRRLQLASANRAETQGRGFSIRSPDYFREVHEKVYRPGIGRVFFAHRGEECVAALAYLGTGRSGITVRSGCTARGYEHYAMYLLQHAVIEDARSRGFTRLNIGGVPRAAESRDHPQHGLYEFKKGFGGERHLRHSVEMSVGT